MCYVWREWDIHTINIRSCLTKIKKKWGGIRRRIKHTQQMIEKGEFENQSHLWEPNVS